MIAVIAVLIAGMIIYPNYRKRRHAKQDNKVLAEAPTTMQRQRALNVNAEIVKAEPMSVVSRRTGRIIPFEDVDLMFEASGKIVGIYFNEGEFVEKGTLLAKINDLPLQAQLKKLEAQTKLSEDRVYRQQALLDKDAVSQEAYETVVTEYNKLMADIDLMKANIAQTELRAPFDGRIGLRYVSEGAFASPSTRVATLAMVSPLKIEFSVSEAFAKDITPGKRVMFSFQDKDGMTEERYAEVYAVESILDPNTLTLNVRAMVPNEDEFIVAGRHVSVEVESERIENALSVASEAIVPEMGRNIVYLYRNGFAQPVEIVTGLRNDARVQAVSGLHPGDTLITSGVMQLRRDTQVVLDKID